MIWLEITRKNLIFRRQLNLVSSMQKHFFMVMLFRIVSKRFRHWPIYELAHLRLSGNRKSLNMRHLVYFFAYCQHHNVQQTSYHLMLVFVKLQMTSQLGGWLLVRRKIDQKVKKFAYPMISSYRRCRQNVIFTWHPFPIQKRHGFTDWLIALVQNFWSWLGIGSRTAVRQSLIRKKPVNWTKKAT